MKKSWNGEFREKIKGSSIFKKGKNKGRKKQHNEIIKEYWKRRKTGEK